VAYVVADAIRPGLDEPGPVAEALAAHAVRFGLRRGDGVALLRWLLELVRDPNTSRWIGEATLYAANPSTGKDNASLARLSGESCFS
jgi:hypothetical protein